MITFFRFKRAYFFVKLLVQDTKFRNNTADMIFIFLKIFISRTYFLIVLRLIFAQFLDDVLKLMQMMIGFNELPLDFLFESTRVFLVVIFRDWTIFAISHVGTHHLNL